MAAPVSFSRWLADYFARLNGGGFQRPSSASGLGAYRRIVTPNSPLLGAGSQFDS